MGAPTALDPALSLWTFYLAMSLRRRLQIVESPEHTCAIVRKTSEVVGVIAFFTGLAMNGKKDVDNGRRDAKSELFTSE